MRTPEQERQIKKAKTRLGRAMRMVATKDGAERAESIARQAFAKAGATEEEVSQWLYDAEDDAS